MLAPPLPRLPLPTLVLRLMLVLRFTLRSMSTWISAGRMFLSSDLPLVREYNSMATDAIATFPTNDAPTLAEAVLRFDRGSLAEAPILALRRALHVSQIGGAHMAIYREALRGARGSSTEAQHPGGAV